MKKIKKFFAVLAVSAISLFGSSCDPEPEDGCDLGAFVEYPEAETFYDTYSLYVGSKALIDTRDTSSYAAGHLAGAVNLPATTGNPDNVNSQWCKDLEAMFPDKNTCLFFYGTPTSEMINAVGNNASRIGYGKANSRICAKGYEELKKVWMDELGKFSKYSDGDSYYNVYSAYSGSKVLIDTRSKEEYEAGHLKNAVNMPVDADSISSDSAQWCKDLLATYPTNTGLFFYGSTTNMQARKIAGRASNIGYGEKYTYIFSDGYDDLKEPWEALGSFVEYQNAETYYETYASYSGAKALIDTRDSSSFAAGHLDGAVNFPATIYNTDSNDAQWCLDLLAAYPINTCLFFYGQTSFQMVKIVAGRASKIGYGKAYSRICSKNYEELKEVWK